MVPHCSSPNTTDHHALEVTETKETKLDPLVVSDSDLPSDLPEPVIAHIQELQVLLQSHGLVSLIYRPGDLVTSAFDLSSILAVNQSTTDELDISNISASVLTEELTASTPNTELPQQSTVDSGNVNTVDMTTPARIQVNHPTVSDIKVAGCSFYDLCGLPKRERKACKRRLKSPSYHLTSEAHLGIVRNVLAKRQKVEEGRQHRKIAAEERKAKSKTKAVVTGKRKQGNCKAATKVTQKGKNANKADADINSRKVKDQSQSTRPPKNSHRPKKQVEMRKARKVAQKLT